MSLIARLSSFALVAAILGAASPCVLAAQQWRGSVRDSVTGRPVAGAVVMLLDSTGSVVARNMTDETGAYRIKPPVSARALRVVRIGFRPHEERLPSAIGAIDVVMTPVTMTLAAVTVRDKSDCPVRRDDAAALGLWEQARDGLLATVVAREANPATMDRIVFERRMEGTSDRIMRLGIALHSGERADNSFSASFSAADFAKSGFATDSGGVQLLFGPDADVLLDASFAAAYCFRVAAPNRARPREVGLSFGPARHKDGRVDIDGTLWIDTTQRALTSLEFLYQGLPPYAERYRAGGRISFRRMDNGVALIDAWQLRAVTESKQDREAEAGSLALGLASGSATPLRELSVIEFGGELSRASWPDGLSWKASLGTVRVHAVTSTGQPAAGTLIGLRDTPYLGTVDEHGDVTIEGLLPGPYWPQSVDARLSEIGMWIPSAPMFEAARDSTVRVTGTVPTAEEYVVNRCAAMHQKSPAGAMLVVGRVTNRDGTPVKGATVIYARQGSAGWAQLREHMETGWDGTFQECTADLHMRDVLRIRVQRDGEADVDFTTTILSTLTVAPVRVP